MKKLDRLKRGGSPTVLDLFAGCGGLSLGFKTAGFKIVGTVEIDPIASRSHALNFFSSGAKREFEIHSQPRDITQIEPFQLIKEISIRSNEITVDIIIGGPPCQAFARVGRAKLREVAEHPQAFLKDPRSNLFLRYLHYVKKLKPLAILMENVPDALNYGGHNIAEETCEVLNDMGYECKYTMLNSVFYGVSQMRERMFLIAYAKEVRSNVTFPSPTHWIELPVGYKGTRSVALKPLGKYFENQQSLLEAQQFYMPQQDATPDLIPAVTSKEAIGDLPPITSHLEGKLKKGARRFDKLIPYTEFSEPSAYAKLMRKWSGFENKSGVSDHVIRYLPRDYAIFRRMNPGDQYPQAYQHALDMLNERIERLSTYDSRIIPGTAEYEQLKKEIVPPYDPGKFPNKWRKMDADKPARTLMAHLGKDSYSHIHYDSAQARTISVREAARLQSFPDRFIFAGTMNPALRQIGNAVPPMFAYAIACEIINGLRGRKCHKKLL